MIRTAKVLRNTMLLILLFCIVSYQATAEYPNKPVQIICPYGAGGSTDRLLRILANAMQKIGITTTIINRPGAGGTIGTLKALNARPDGYTIGTYGIWVEIGAVKNQVPKNLVDGLVPISLIANGSPFLIANKSIDIQSLNDIRGRTGITLGTAGGVLKKYASILSQKIGCDFSILPISGSAQTLAALLDGHIDLALVFLSSSAVQNFRPIAVFSETRDALVPDTPTAVEMGLPLVFYYPRGLFVPQGTPPDVVKTLESVIRRAVKSDHFRDIRNKIGIYDSWYKNAQESEAIVKGLRRAVRAIAW